MDGRESKRHQISQDLLLLRRELAELVQENDALPLDKQVLEMSLDKVTRKKCLENAALQLCKDGTSMEVRSVQQRHAIHKVLHSCWYSMHVQGRYIKTVGCNAVSVRNFPLPRDTSDSKNQVQQEVARHELVLSVTRLITFKPWQTMTDSELEQRLNASPLDRRSFKTVAEGVQRLLGELWQAQARTGESESVTAYTGASEASGSDAKERAVQSGSITHTLLTPEQSPALSLVLPFQQIELNISTHEASKHAFLLNNIITQLKQLFNCEFDALWHVKEEQLGKMKEFSSRLWHIGQELGEKNDKFAVSTWDIIEKPELLVDQENEDEVLSSIISESSMTTADTFCARTLDNMMDDHVDVNLQERLARQITPPLCMSKPTNKWTDDERNVFENYERRVTALCSERESYQSQLLQERTQLRAALKESCHRFDVMLGRLEYRRLAVETAVQQEQLKVARIKLWSLMRSHAIQREKRLRCELQVCDAKVSQLIDQRQQLQSRCELKKKMHEAMLAQDRQQARGFRREFTQLSPMVVDQLAKVYRRRPAVQLSAAQLRFLSRKLGTNEECSEAPEVVTEPCRMYMAALRVMDAATNVSPSVDTTAWAALCRLRRAKVEAEIKVKASALEMSEAESALTSLDVALESERSRKLEFSAQLEHAIEQKRRLLLNTGIQVLVRRGRIELMSIESVSECEQAIMVSLEMVRLLNKGIRESGARKLAALREGLMFRAGCLRQSQWHASKTEAMSHILQQELEQVEKMTISSDLRQFLRNHVVKKSSRKKTSYEQELLVKQTEGLSQELRAFGRDKNVIDRNNAALNINIISREHQVQQEHEHQVIPSIPHRIWAEQSRMQRMIRADSEELQKLRDKLDKMKLRTFPTLFDVSF